MFDSHSVPFHSLLSTLSLFTVCCPLCPFSQSAVHSVPFHSHSVPFHSLLSTLSPFTVRLDNESSKLLLLTPHNDTVYDLQDALGLLVSLFLLYPVLLCSPLFFLWSALLLCSVPLLCSPSSSVQLSSADVSSLLVQLWLKATSVS